MMAVSAVLAWLSYRYIETPARQSQAGFALLTRRAGAAGAGLALCGGLYDAAWGLPWRAPQSVQAAYAAKFPGYRESDRADCLKDQKRPGSLPRPCPIGAPATDMQYDFAIWGDSHARHFATAFSDQARARGLAGIVIWEARCPPLLDGGDDTRAVCTEANHLAWEWIATQTRLKAVFLGAIWASYMPGPAVGAEGGAPAYPALERTIERLRARGLSVAVVETVPSFPVNVPDCAARARMFGRSDEHCFTLSRARLDASEARGDSMLREVGRRTGIPVVETHQAFCGEDSCRAEKDGVIFYTDGSHLNSAGSRYLGARMNIPWPQR